MPRIKPQTLLMLSGGIDSTGCFYKLVQEKVNLHVHHLHLDNPEQRHKAEAVAVQSILEYMRKLGDFTYSESYHKHPDFNGNFLWDSDIFSFTAGHICHAIPTIEKVAIGMTASDQMPGLGDRVLRAAKVFAAFGTKAKKIYPVEKMTKREVYDMMPADLRCLTWSCRTPIYRGGDMALCGRCKACHELKNSGIV